MFSKEEEVPLKNLAFIFSQRYQRTAKTEQCYKVLGPLRKPKLLNLMRRNCCKTLRQTQLSPNITLFQIKFAAEQCWKRWIPVSRLKQHITDLLGDKAMKGLHFSRMPLVFILLRTTVQTKDLISRWVCPKEIFL